MILLFDVGNSSIGIGVASKDALLENYRLTTDVQRSYDDYYISIKNLIDVTTINAIAISSVVPRITELLVKVAKKFFNITPLVLTHGVKTGIAVKTASPKEVGSDLICAAAGLDNNTSPTLVIDLGTAIKYLYIKNKTITGAIISPGMSISIKALVGNTALLPDIDVIVPKKVLGNNTIECMQSGVTYGIACQLDGLISRIKEEVNEDFVITATGGFSSIIVPLCKTNMVRDNNLVLKGLLKIYNKNTSDGGAN
jgi:type III pantothenate kinase